MTLDRRGQTAIGLRQPNKWGRAVQPAGPVASGSVGTRPDATGRLVAPAVPRNEEARVSGMPRMDAPDLLKARSHPTRQDILRVMRETDKPMSPSRVFKKLKAKGTIRDRDNGHIAYHFRALAKADLLILVEERKVRGATEHLYEIAEDIEAEIGDAAALDDMAERIRQDASAPDLLGEITKLIQATGRLPVRKATRPAIKAPTRLERAAADAFPVAAVCSCGGGPADGNGACLSCGKRRGKAEAA